jgi:pimeloyl-ACP methyl ester carboxylesterase
MRTMFRMFVMFAALLGITVSANSICAAPNDDAVRPLGIGLEEIAYPHPVRFLDLVVEGQALRMAYMDVAPTGSSNGKTVVLLHGKSFSGNYWEDTIRRLTDDGYRVVVPDQIGFGKSSKPDLRYSFDLLAANTRKLLETLGVQRAAVVGHSFGGMLAIYFARTYPDMTTVLALENPIGLEDYRSAIPPQSLATLVATEMMQTPDSYRNFMKAFFATWTPEREAMVDVFARILKSGEYPRYARASALTYEMMYQQPIRHELHLLTMPVLLIIGQSDRSVFFRRYARPEDVRGLGNWPALGRAAVKDLVDGQLAEIDGAGHVSHIERTQEFLSVLTKFLATRM